MGTAEGHTEPVKERDTRRENWKEGRKERGHEVRRERRDGKRKRTGYYLLGAPCPPSTEMLTTWGLRISDP